MSRMSSRGLVATLLLALAACGGTPPLPPAPPEPPPVPPTSRLAAPEPAARETPDAPFREHMPDAQGSVTFTPPHIETFRLKNGLKVLLVERHDLPIVSLRVVVKGGAGDLPNVRPGVLSFMGSMLDQGTTTRSAIQLSDELEAIGAQHSAFAGWDSANAGVKVLKKFLDPALALLADEVLHPVFPEAEVARLKARRLSALQQEKTSPGAASWNALFSAVYGRAHPYGHALGGAEADVQRIARPEVVAAYHAAFVPSRAAIVVAGDVTRAEIAPKLEAAFGAWRAPGGGITPPKPPVEKADVPRLVLVDLPGATQSQVLLTEVGAPFSAPDRDTVTVMNAILGGAFSSRINMNLREAHAYTYGARSRFAMRHGAGPFSAGGAMFAEATAPAVQELFKEVRAMLEREVTTEELSDAKEHLKLGLPGNFETLGDVTSALEDLVVYDLPLDEYEKWGARIEAVTAADVKKAATQHLRTKALRVVIVGDRSKIASALETLHLGEPLVLDAYGDPVAADPKPAAKR